MKLKEVTGIISNLQSLIAKLELPIKLVIQKVLEKFKELAIIEIINNTPHIERATEKVKCVVTVHAIWDEHQKIIMMESCIVAGLVNENNIFLYFLN